MLASGFLDLVLAVILLAGLPGTAVWALGVLLGVKYDLRRYGADFDGPAGSLGRWHGACLTQLIAYGRHSEPQSFRGSGGL